MTEGRSYLNMMNSLGFLSSNVLRMISEINAMYAQITPSMQEAFKVSIRQTQEIAQIMAPAIREWQESTVQLANLMTPAICAVAKSTAKMQIELQPLFRVLSDVHPSAIQLTELFQKVSQYADEMGFARDFYEVYEFNEEEKQAAVKTAREILSEPDNWQQKLAKSLAVAKEHHPVFAKAVIWVLNAVIVIVLNVSANYLYDTIKSAKLREEPSQGAPVITMVKASQIVNVINDTKYYFKIEYTDSVSGKTYSGWISKLSIQNYKEEEDRETDATP